MADSVEEYEARIRRLSKAAGNLVAERTELLAKLDAIRSITIDSAELGDHDAAEHMDRIRVEINGPGAVVPKWADKENRRG